MQRRFLAPLTAGLVLLGASTLLRAEVGVAHCVGIADDAARLACFDAATRGPSGAPAAAPAPAASAGANGGADVAAPAAAAAKTVGATPATVDSDFGMTAERESGPGAITATVRSVAAHTIPGRWVVTLDNDQVWEQRETTAANRRPRPGDSVTIERSSFGSYLMTASGRGSSRVKRLR